MPRSGFLFKKKWPPSNNLEDIAPVYPAFAWSALEQASDSMHLHYWLFRDRTLVRMLPLKESAGESKLTD
jgi:hypothetical protein